MSKLNDVIVQGFLDAINEAADLGLISEAAADFIFYRSTDYTLRSAKAGGVFEELIAYAGALTEEPVDVPEPLFENEADYNGGCGCGAYDEEEVEIVYVYLPMAALFFPNWGEWDDITPEIAVKAIDNFLKTGDPQWADLEDQAYAARD